MEYYAHKKATLSGEKEYQTVREHLEGTAEIASRRLSPVGLKNTAYLAGLLHDMGKFTTQFQSYLDGQESLKRGSVIHTFQGCRFVMENLRKDGDYLSALTSELIAFAIGAHHGLFDCVDAAKRIGLKYRIEKEDINYEEALQSFLTQYGREDVIFNFFNASVSEIDFFIRRIEELYPDDNEYCFEIGLLARLILSAVIDGDRHNTASFMTDVDVRQWPQDMTPIWENRLCFMEGMLERFASDTPVTKARHYISSQCRKFAEKPPGIYRLNVPTGSGKTLSSLRYSLAHGMLFNKRRLIFTSPLLSILEQNALEIRKYVGDDDLILEHHSNVIQVETNQQELDQRELLVQCWDAPIIITTLVQLLYTLFDGATTSIRRFQALCDSVIVIDEVQTVPTKMLTLFNLAIRFLSEQCGATVVLCSATQPDLEGADHPLISPITEIVPYEKTIWDAFQRTDIRPLEAMRLEELPQIIASIMEQAESLLVVCNKKDEAAFLFEQARLLESTSYHLSASMCTQHRRDVIKRLKQSLENHEKTLCISTQVIEAGVDISFSCVLRLAAGLDSIIQSAGRCNRNGESNSLCPVYTVNCSDERLGKLLDIQRGKTATIDLISAFQENPDRFGNDLASDTSVRFYYQSFYRDMRKHEQDDFIPQLDTTIYDLMSVNEKNADFQGVESFCLWQALKTAGQFFSVFDENTVDVIVPYDRARMLIQELCSSKCANNPVYLDGIMKELNGFTVSLYQYQKERLEEQKALIPICDGAFFALADGYYDENLGVVMVQEKQDFWEV